MGFGSAWIVKRMLLGIRRGERGDAGRNVAIRAVVLRA